MTSLRTKGLAIYITFNNLGNAFNQFVNPIALDSISYRCVRRSVGHSPTVFFRYYALYIALDFFVATVAYFQFPETRRMTIEEVSLMFDYGVKEGRARALESLENHQSHGVDPADARGKSIEEVKHAEEQIENSTKV